MKTREPRGWSEQPGKIEAIIKADVESLALFREAMVEGPGKRSKDCDYIADIVSNIPVDHGNSKAYTVSRLKRDRPDLFEKVVAGELSANKAVKWIIINM